MRSMEDAVTQGPHPPRMRSGRVRLRAIAPRDYPFLYHLATAEEVAYRWRYRGATPSPEEFQQQLWRNVLAQFVVEGVGPQGGWRPIGHVAAFDPSHRDRWVHLAGIASADVLGTGLLAEAACVLVDYLFTHWAFEKIYLSIVEYNLPQFASGMGRGMRQEGRLRRHCFYDGRFWDMVLCSIFREDWTGNWRTTLGGQVTSGVRPDMDVDAFIRAVCEEMSDGGGPWSIEDQLAEDLNFDSLQFVMALDLVCQWSGHQELPVDAADTLPRTMRELYLAYCRLSQMPTVGAKTRMDDSWDQE